ncbi:MAG: glycosyltransferase family A protein [Tissierellaceae bacterium]|nr:glycosyltransferase family A protein [Tissierellaceae bacterium]
MGISVITPTIREENMNNIIDNFERQNYKRKELIIILNYYSPNIKKWELKISEYDNISIYVLNPKYSLGECLNYAISKSNFDFIAKFDDDDYYGANYLDESIFQFKNNNAHIIGKSSIYLYFKDEKVLRLLNKSKENKFVNRVCGSTLFFRKDIINKIKFQDINLSEDRLFCEDAINHGFKIYSTSNQNYIYIRSAHYNHSWKIHNDYLYKTSSKIAESITFEEAINRVPL